MNSFSLASTTCSDRKSRPSVEHHHQGLRGVFDETRSDSSSSMNTMKFRDDAMWGQGQFDDDDGGAFNGVKSTQSDNKFQDYHIHHEDESSLKRVRDLVSFSQRIVRRQAQVENNENSHFSEPLLQPLEPTPLGPRETQTIVSQLSLAEIKKWMVGNCQDLITFLSFVGHGSTTTTSDSSSSSSMNNKKRPACIEGDQALAGGWPLPTQRNKKFKNSHHPLVSNLQQAMPFPEPEEAEGSLIFAFDDDDMSQASTTAAGPIKANLSQPKEQPNTFSYNCGHESSSSQPIATKNMLHPHHCDQWNDRFQDLIEFKTLHGHCFVPHDYPKNPKLAQWVKRQRYQYRLKHSGRHSTMTDFRERALEEMGFVWDSHKAGWTEKLETLKMFKAFHGHCNVPSNYDSDPSLAIWVKCQRRQYRLYCQGKQSTMNDERVSALNSLEFDWNPRRI